MILYTSMHGASLLHTIEFLHSIDREVIIVDDQSKFGIGLIILISSISPDIHKIRVLLP